MVSKDTNRKIRKTELIYICGSKNGSSCSTVNTAEVWGYVSPAEKTLCMPCYLGIWYQNSNAVIYEKCMLFNVPIFLLVSLVVDLRNILWLYLQAATRVKCTNMSNQPSMKDGNSPISWYTTKEGCSHVTLGLVTKPERHRPEIKIFAF